MRLGRTVLKLFGFLCLIAAFQVAIAQKYDLVIHNSETGLVGNQVNDIAQDKSGVIWVATNNGVSAFDGISFVNYTQSSGLSEDLCVSVLVDDQGRIWVGHQAGGVSLIDNDSIYRFRETEGLVNNEVHDIIQSENGNIWVATFGGISIYDGETWSRITTENGLSFNNIQVLEQFSDGAIWAGSYGAGINVIDGSKVEHLHMGNGLVNNYVTSLREQDGHMLVGTLGGLANWDGKRFTSDAYTKEMFSNQINDLVVDQQQHLWLATFNGAVRLANGRSQRISQLNGLPQNEVLDVFTDVEDNVWLGTKEGLVRVRSFAFSHFTSNELIDIYPTSVFVDSKQNVWAGNEAGGVLTFDGELFVQAFEDPDLNDHQISAIAEDGDGNLWFGTMDFGGLFQWDGSKFYIYSDEFGMADNNINCMATDADGILYIGTPNGLSTFDGMDFQIVYLSEDFATSHITALQSLPNGEVIVGSKDGTVHRIKDGEPRVIEGLNISSRITDICSTKDGIAISTLKNGVYTLEEGLVVRYDKANGLPADGASSVFVAEDRLYTTCGQTIVKFNVGQDTTTVSVLDRNAGYLGGAGKYGANCSYNGIQVIGTEKGITLFDPSELKADQKEPITQLTELQLAYQSVDWTENGYELLPNGLPNNLELSYTDNNIRFIFRGIDHSNPEGISYKWKLEGYEKEWTPANSQGVANYPNLPPGDYTFKLIACSSSGTCNAEEVSYSFYIVPPIWKRTWFHILVIVLVIVTVVLLVRRREQILLKEKEILESTVAERTKELREQKEIVELQNEHITESIEYASNIQKAILPSEADLKDAFEDHFVFYRPKETVGGDFYWAYHTENVAWAAAVDCTGHGVAGAFMSMIGSDLLNQIIIEKRITDPAEVLLEMDKGIKLAFAQSAKEFEADQGMDVALVCLNKKAKTIQFAGAQRSLFIYHNDGFEEIEGDKISISCTDETVTGFTTNDIAYRAGASIYLFSDGVTDQFGGPKSKKFMVRRLKEFFDANHSAAMPDQLAVFEKTFDSWRGDDNPQLDDVMLMGIRL
jgi:ligand-binding sensor domain-containing protein/serine phosphatase RsbU (regulator of sigma subunit)